MKTPLTQPTLEQNSKLRINCQEWRVPTENVLMDLSCLWGVNYQLKGHKKIFQANDIAVLNSS